MTMFGAPGGPPGNGGHHAVESSSVRPTTPSNCPGSMTDPQSLPWRGDCTSISVRCADRGASPDLRRSSRVSALLRLVGLALGSRTATAPDEAAHHDDRRQVREHGDELAG